MLLVEFFTGFTRISRNPGGRAWAGTIVLGAAVGWTGSEPRVSSCEGGASTSSAPMSKRPGLGESPRRESPRRESGFTLIEVVLSGALVLGVLVPSAALLGTSDQVLSLNRDKVVAANIAAGQLEADRAAAAQPWSAGAPVLPTPASPQQVPTGGVSYTVTQAGAWCAESTNAGTTTWTTYTSPSSQNPPAYTVTVTVSWLGGLHSVSASETLTTYTGVTAPSSSTGSCPS